MRYVILLILLSLCNSISSNIKNKFIINDTISIKYNLIDSIKYRNYEQDIFWIEYKNMNIQNKAKTLDSMLKFYFSMHLKNTILTLSYSGKFDPIKFQHEIDRIDSGMVYLLDSDLTFKKEIEFYNSYFSNIIEKEMEEEYFEIHKKYFNYNENVTLIYFDNINSNQMKCETSIFFWMLSSLIDETKDYSIYENIEIKKLYEIEKYFSSFYFSTKKKELIYNYLKKYK